MKYGYLYGFMYNVGDGVGEFLPDEERSSFTPMTLPEIVHEYVDSDYLLHAFILRWQIKRYIEHNVTREGLRYVDPPFDQETSFPENYFDGDLYAFLTNVLALLDFEIRARVRALLRFSG